MFYTNSIPTGSYQESVDEVFLLYTKGFEHGPGINRDGMGEPWMEDRNNPERKISNPIEQRRGTWLIDGKEAKEMEVAYIEKQFECKNIKKSERDDWLKELGTTPNYFDEFKKHYDKNYEIVGMQGCGNLTMNQWFVAYLNSPFNSGQGKFIFLYDEKPQGKKYSCFIKWKGKEPRYTIEDVRFNMYTNHIQKVEDNSNITDEVEFVVFGQKLVDKEKLVNLETITDQFADIRHLYKLPNINPDTEFDSKKVLYHSKRPRLLFGKAIYNDVWFGERQMTRKEHINLLKLALTEPILLDKDFHGMGAFWDLIEASFEREKYRNVSDDPPRNRGQWRMYNDSLVQIFLHRNVYATTMVGLDAESNIIASAAGGHAGIAGQTLEAMAQNMIGKGAREVLLIDEGNDVFQWYQGRYIVPPRRGRIRAVFIFARKKQEP
jgi:hypothetical protein